MNENENNPSFTEDSTHPTELATSQAANSTQLSHGELNNVGGAENKSVDLPVEHAVNAVTSVENTVETGKPKRSRCTDAQKNALIEQIKSDIRGGCPLQEIALKQGITMNMLTKIFSNLMLTDFREEIVIQSYDVVAAGTPVSKLPFKIFEGVKFIRVEYHEDCLLIKPFKLED